MSDLIKRAEKLDKMREKGISEKLTIEEAQNIVSVWGLYLEHSGTIRYLFGINIPESILPFPINIIQGALNKMEAHYFNQGMHYRVRLLEETEACLMQYTNDEDAVKESAAQFNNKKWQAVFITGFKDFQMKQMESGFLVDKNLWKLSRSRLEELEK